MNAHAVTSPTRERGPWDAQTGWCEGTQPRGSREALSGTSSPAGRSVAHSDRLAGSGPRGHRVRTKGSGPPLERAGWYETSHERNKATFFRPCRRGRLSWL